MMSVILIRGMSLRSCYSLGWVVCGTALVELVFIMALGRGMYQFDLYRDISIVNSPRYCCKMVLKDEYGMSLSTTQLVLK